MKEPEEKGTIKEDLEKKPQRSILRTIVICVVIILVGIIVIWKLLSFRA